MLTRIKEAIECTNYAVACAEEAAAHYGESFTEWDRFVCWWKGFLSIATR